MVYSWVVFLTAGFFLSWLVTWWLFVQEAFCPGGFLSGWLFTGWRKSVWFFFPGGFCWVAFIHDPLLYGKSFSLFKRRWHFFWVRLRPPWVRIHNKKIRVCFLSALECLCTPELPTDSYQILYTGLFGGRYFMQQSDFRFSTQFWTTVYTPNCLCVSYLSAKLGKILHSSLFKWSVLNVPFGYRAAPRHCSYKARIWWRKLV